jgi:pilus assembly protein CpaC
MRDSNSSARSRKGRLASAFSQTAFALLLAASGTAGFSQAPQALEVIRTTEQVDLEVNKGTILRLDRDAETVFVSDPEIVDVQVRSKRTLFVYGLQNGETTLFALDANDKPIVSISLKVNHNVTSATSVIKRLSPDSEVTITSVPNGLVVQGTVQTPQAADEVSLLAAQFLGKGEQVINRLSVLAPTQVNLRIRIVEASRETVRALGVSWVFNSIGKFAISGATPSPDFALDSANNRLVMGYSGINDSVNSYIDALDTEGILSVLAEPNLTAISGETASFLSGGEFPIPVGIDDNEIEIQFKEFGVSLAFTPIVLSGNRINLHIRSEVSQLSESAGIELNGAKIPGLTTRRADTTIELGSGQSFAIAGLIQNRKLNELSKVPGLGSIPLFGKLFQSRRFQKEETELIIIATPYLVKPVDPTTPLRGPTDEGAATQQFEQLLRGQSQSSNTNNSYDDATDGEQLSTPVGFIME